MKDFNLYILEKLKINKNTKLSDNINGISNGNICGIFRMYQANNAGAHLIPDIIKINEISSENKTVTFTYLTNKFGKFKTQETLKISSVPDKSYKFRGISSFQSSSKPCTILNKEDMLNYLKSLLGNEKILNWFDITYKVFPARTKPDIKVEYLIPSYTTRYPRNPNKKYNKEDFNELNDKRIQELIDYLDV